MSSDDAQPHPFVNARPPGGEDTRLRERTTRLPSSRRLLGDGYFASDNSMRLHGRAGGRGSFAARLATPIIAAVIVGLVVLSLVIRNRIMSMQVEDLKTEAVYNAFSASLLARLVITQRERFLQDNPTYRASAEWRTGDHWLVAGGLVRPDDWSRATGFQMGEFAPVSVLEKAAESATPADFGQYLNSTSVDSEIIAVFILDGQSAMLASSRKSSFRFNPLDLAQVAVSPEVADVDGIRLHVDYIRDIAPEPVMRGVARIMDPEDREKLLGSAVVVLRTARYSRARNSLILLLVLTGVPMTLFMIGVCWFAARRVLQPIRRLAADMQAFAGGDYTRKADWGREGDELGLLAQSFNSMAERLRIAMMSEKESSRLESDLAIAREIQNNLLPPQTPYVRGYDIFTTYRPAREIGGDYYDFLPIDDRHIGVVVADASGKSIPAALVMSTTRAILRFVAPGDASAADTLTRINAILSADVPRGMFVTAYYIILDPLGGDMLCASAGHTPLLLARADGSVEMINPGGIALGFDSGPIFQRSIREQRVKLSSGDRVLLYTDGVVECANAANEEYSDRRLREFLRRNRELTSHDFVGALMADLDRHRGPADIRDDTTIVTFKVI